MAHLPEPAIDLYLRLGRRNRIWTDTAAAQRHLSERYLRPTTFAPPRRLRGDVSLSRRRVRGWPVYELAPTAGPTRGTVVYTHGGGWVNEIVVQHWRLCARIAAEAGVRVLVPIYPLIPEATAADVVAGVAELAVEADRDGPLCLAGDSAGGQIALAAALVVRDRFGIRAGQTVLISPALDATLSNPEIPAVETVDPWLGRAGVEVFTDVWRGDLTLTDPLVSPVYGDLTGLGPLTVFIGTRDILWPDTRRLAERARAAGVRVDLHERPGLVHVYPLLPTAEGEAARRTIITTVRESAARA
ncbi:MAG TPA: alpha/beta hydrolase fold domain-containing protein [Solirubrobacteraceae bacterium]|nr:alpha/beta hydrolase fold domain-containing protein [Solirubrobacteraceae bacterium]